MNEATRAAAPANPPTEPVKVGEAEIELGTIAEVDIAIDKKTRVYLGVVVSFLTDDRKLTDKILLPKDQAPAVAAKLLHCGLHVLARSIAEAWFAGEAQAAGLNYELRP